MKQLAYAVVRDRLPCITLFSCCCWGNFRSVKTRFVMYYEYHLEVCLCFQNAIPDLFFLIFRFMVGVFLKTDVGTDVWYSK